MRFAKVYVEITNICNRHCAFCPGTARPPELMSLERFQSIAERLRGYTKFLYFHLMGEPLIHPALAELLSAADALGFRVILTTNGTLLGEKQQVLLQANPLHKVNISLHSHEANGGGGLQDYIQTCCDFAAAAAKRGVIVCFRLWNLDGSQTTGQHERNPEILELLHKTFAAPWQEDRRGLRLEERVYLQWGEKFQWPDMGEPEGSQRLFCYGLKDQIGVLCDGTVVPCCLDHEGDIPLGNLLEDTLEEILTRPRTQAICVGFAQHRAVEPLCRRCGYARRFG